MKLELIQALEDTARLCPDENFNIEFDIKLKTVFIYQVRSDGSVHKIKSVAYGLKKDFFSDKKAIEKSIKNFENANQE